MFTFEVKNLNLKQIFECGQAFRWQAHADGSWTGVCGGRAARVWAASEHLLCIENLGEAAGVAPADAFFWKTYFDLDTDYDAIKMALEEKSPDLTEALAFGSGIRLLNQALFEMLITFILSANNHIPRIRQLVERLSQHYGTPIELVSGEVCYSFPTPEALSQADLETLRTLGLGYRDAYVLESSKRAAAMGADFDRLTQLPYKEAKEALLAFSGVGPKVADCILLFSAGAHEAFPVDTWVKKTLERRYGIKGSVKAIDGFAENRFGALKGFANQFLFYFERENERK